MIKIIGVITDSFNRIYIKDNATEIVGGMFFGASQKIINSLTQASSNITVVLIPHVANFKSYLNLCDGLVTVGGRDIPPHFYNEKVKYTEVAINDNRYDFEIPFIQSFVKLNKPILAICAGMQSLNVALGGSLFQDIKKDTTSTINHRSLQDYQTPVHQISIVEHSLLKDIIKNATIEVNSAHHQAVKKLGTKVEIAAIAEDGIVEAIELKDHIFGLGVQWHPEYHSCVADKKIFSSFIKAIQCKI